MCVSVRMRTDTRLCTEGNCAGMYSVHDRVVVDNMFEFQQDRKMKYMQKLKENMQSKSKSEGYLLSVCGCV